MTPVNELKTKHAFFYQDSRKGILGYLSILRFAFILTNRFAGRPGDYVYVFNQYRMEEVNI